MPSNYDAARRHRGPWDTDPLEKHEAFWGNDIRVASKDIEDQKIALQSKVLSERGVAECNRVIRLCKRDIKRAEANLQAARERAAFGLTA